ncbi:MAG: LamG-like jellyroll fold domain-containing protein, partial [Candidatus Paceibacterota bacterium]
HSKERAFTLIELLVVIAIVGILSSVIYTNITGLRDRAKVTAGIRFDSSTLHSIGDMLVGEWTFDSPNLPLIDTSGFGNVGTCTSCPTYSTTSGYNNKGAYSFDGSYKYITLPNDIGLGTQELTVSIWVKLNSYSGASNRRPFISDWNTYVPGSQKGFSLSSFFTRTYPAFQICDGTDTHSVNSRQDMSLNTWYNVVGVFSANSVLKIYLNGTQTGSATPPSQYVKESSTPIYIGRQDVNGGTMDGIIDDVRIYSSALSSSDIQKLYAEGAPLHKLSEN